MKYFYEKNTPEYKIGIEISKKLYSKKNKYHKVDILKGAQDKTLLVIDGVIKFTSEDEFVYSETMAHYSLFSHPNPERILIIGGGDGSILREVLKHKRVQEIYLLEKHEDLIKISKEFFPEFELEKNIESKKVKFTNEEEIEFLNKFEEYFDIIILDEEEKRRKSFYKEIHSTLSKDGLLIQRLGKYVFEKEFIKKTKNNIKSIFNYVELIRNTSFMEEFYVMASKKVNIEEISLKIINLRLKQFSGKASLKHFSAERYVAARILSKNQQQEFK